MEEWYEVYEKIHPFVVKIETVSGHGTGFLCNLHKGLAAIATAKHVIDRESKWLEPIRIISSDGRRQMFLDTKPKLDRVIIPDENQDVAIILYNENTYEFFPGVSPGDLIPLLPKEFFPKVGVELGWAGFPGLLDPQKTGIISPSFFSGKVSNSGGNPGPYYIDGSAMKGVSGGPVFYTVHGNEIDRRLHIVGVISDFIFTNDPLPGLSVAQDLTRLHAIIEQYGSLEEAQEKNDAGQELFGKLIPVMQQAFLKLAIGGGSFEGEVGGEMTISRNIMALHDFSQDGELVLNGELTFDGAARPPTLKGNLVASDATYESPVVIVLDMTVNLTAEPPYGGTMTVGGVEYDVETLMARL